MSVLDLALTLVTSPLQYHTVMSYKKGHASEAFAVDVVESAETAAASCGHVMQ